MPISPTTWFKFVEIHVFHALQRKRLTVHFVLDPIINVEILSIADVDLLRGPAEG